MDEITSSESLVSTSAAKIGIIILDQKVLKANNRTKNIHLCEKCSESNSFPHLLFMSISIKQTGSVPINIVNKIDEQNMIAFTAIQN